MHPPAHPARGFVDGRGDAGVLQREGCVQACDAPADDGDAALGAEWTPGRSQRGDRAGEGRRADGGAGCLEEIATREPHLVAFLLDHVDGSAGAICFFEILGQRQETSQQRGSRHGLTDLLGQKTGPPILWEPCCDVWVVKWSFFTECSRWLRPAAGSGWGWCHRRRC